MESTLVLGTLVVIVPTKEGLIAAADSRSSNEFQTAFCDQDYKLIEIEPGPSRTIATITGLAGMRRPSNDSDYCRHLREAETWLDLKMQFKSYLEGQSESASSVSIENFEPYLDAVFAALSPDAIPFLEPLKGQQLSNLIVASYDPETSTSWLRYARLTLSRNLEPIIAGETVVKIGLDDQKMFYRLGEQPYADQQMTSGALASLFRQQQTLTFLATPGTVQTVTKDVAIAAAADFIDAVSARTRVVPAPTAIGGPVDILFMGKDPEVERVRWKSPPSAG